MLLVVVIGVVVSMGGCILVYFSVIGALIDGLIDVVYFVCNMCELVCFVVVVLVMLVDGCIIFVEIVLYLVFGVVFVVCVD